MHELSIALSILDHADERRPASVQELCCPVCGAPTPQVVRGRELEVVALELES